MTLYSELFLSKSSISCLTSSTFSWCEAVTCSKVQYYKLAVTGTFSFLHNLLTSSISIKNEERKMKVLHSVHASSSFQFLFYTTRPYFFTSFPLPYLLHTLLFSSFLPQKPHLVTFLLGASFVYPWNTLIIKKIKFSSYVRKFRCERLQSHK